MALVKHSRRAPMAPAHFPYPEGGAPVILKSTPRCVEPGRQDTAFSRGSERKLPGDILYVFPACNLWKVYSLP